MVYCPRSAQTRRGARAICLQATVLTSDCAYMINRLAAEARVFHYFATLHRKKETNQVSPSVHPHVVSWGQYNSTGPILTKQTQRTKCIIREGVICEAPSHTVFPSVVAVIRLFASRLFISQVRGLRARLSCLPVFYLLFSGKRSWQRPDALIALRTGHGAG